MRFPTYPRDILSRADALLSSKYPDGIVDPRFVEIACEAMMAMTEWQPIETLRDMEAPPRDLLFWNPCDGLHYSALYFDGTLDQIIYEQRFCTHWMPGPSSPVPETAE